MSNAIYEFENKDIINAKIERLRDEFAMAALSFMEIDYESKRDIENKTFYAYKIADQMMKAREEKP